MKTSAAIRRATQRAQNAMRELDAQAVDELRQIYEAAAEDVRQRIAASLDNSDSVPLQNLRRLLAEIETILDGLAQQRDGILATAIERAAELGVEPFTLQGIVRVGGSQAVIDSGEASRISQNAVRFVQTFTATDGLTLSDRLWRVDRGAKEALTRSIEQAVVQGLSGTRAATEFIMRGEPVPDDVAQRVAQARGGPLGLLAGELARRDTGALYQAERVMRTEINRAHGEAFFAAGEATPGRAGWRYLLSPLHPAPDICFRRGTLVSTRRGSIPIEDVRIGDEVLTHCNRWRPVTRLYRTSTGPSGLLRLRFQVDRSRTLELVLTPNHPVLSSQGWLPAGDLRRGQTVVCLVPLQRTPQSPHTVGEGRTARPGSGETEPGFEARSIGSEAHGAGSMQPIHTRRNDQSAPSLPTGSPRSGAPIGRSLRCLRAMLGYLRGAFASTAKAESRLNDERDRSIGAHSLDLPPRALESKRSSSTSDQSGHRGNLAYRSGTEELARHDLPCSKLPSKTLDLSPLARVVHGTLYRTAGSSQPQPSMPREQPHCIGVSSTGHVPFACPADTVQASAEGVDCSARISSCGDHMPVRATLATVDHIASVGEPVFNLEVDEDHTYVAESVVVHNCDLLATQNLHGLGPGVYPTRALTPWPAHPNTLSFIQMVFDEDVSAADRAGKETPLQALARLTPEQRAGAVGVTKAEYFDRGLLRAGMIRSSTGAVTERLQRQGEITAPFKK